MPNSRRKQEINKAAGQAVDVLCGECDRETKHDIVASLDVSGSDGANTR